MREASRKEEADDDDGEEEEEEGWGDFSATGVFLGSSRRRLGAILVRSWRAARAHRAPRGS